MKVIVLIFSHYELDLSYINLKCKIKFLYMASEAKFNLVNGLALFINELMVSVCFSYEEE